MNVLLLGGTDLTLAILRAMTRAGLKPAGVVSLENEFSISYNPSSKNVRYVDIEGVCAQNDIRHMIYRKDMDELIAFSQEIGADFCLVAGWYFILPARFRDLFSKGCVGVHASLLPELRGAAPLNWAILKGFRKTGVSLFEIVRGVDEGFLYAQKTIKMDKRETITTLVKKVESASVSMVLRAIPKIAAGRMKRMPQRGRPSYSCPRAPSDSLIDWFSDVMKIDTLIRASSRPYAGAYTYIDGKKLFIWSAQPFSDSDIYGRPGQICSISDTSVVVCGNGVLQILEATDDDGRDMMPLLGSMNYRNFRKEP